MQGISPFTFTIFGATGDLTKRKLIPALYSLYSKNLLPEDFRIFAFARRPLDSLSFADTLYPFIHSTDRWDSFRTHLHYIQGDFSDNNAFFELRKSLENFEQATNVCPLRMFYLAVSPDEILHIVNQLGTAQLHTGCGEEGKWSRLVIEKPFGSDLASAQALNEGIRHYFKEEQIYRIDHYLGKETVQNILSVRFANILMEPVWNRKYIESIQINAFEELGVEERGGYYDKAGALRDMVQSHLLQVLALTLMQQPLRYDADEIRSKKNEILSALRPMTDERIVLDSVRGQYGGSPELGVKAYREEAKVDHHSRTETFVALRTYVDLEQWRDVPIIIRTGKRLQERRGEIIVTFRRSEGTVFSNLFCELRSNTLKIRLQPDEGVKLQMLIKQPGFSMQLADVFLDYKYSDTYQSLPEAYDRLLMDAIIGDQSLFTRTDEIESSWKYITEILELWDKNSVPLHEYPVGSLGVPF